MKNTINRLERQKRELAEIKKELKRLPAGRLVKKKNTYLHVVGDKQTTITNDHLRIQQLARQKLLSLLQKQCHYNLPHAARYTEKISDLPPTEIIQNLAPTYSSLPLHYFYHPDVQAFLTKTFPSNTYPTEGPTFTSNNGTIVRSKSEVLIANQLEAYNVPYRYEIPLRLGDHRKYPDFIIMQPFTGELLIWEHFGALHQADYEQRMNEKMSLYLKHGYQPWEDLIYTFEFDLAPKRLGHIIEKIILKH